VNIGMAVANRRHVHEPMKTNTTASPVVGLAPAGEFHGGSFGVSGTPPVAAFYYLPSLRIYYQFDSSRGKRAHSSRAVRHMDDPHG